MSRSRRRVPVRVIVAYSDIAAARQAIARLTAELKLSRPEAELHPLLWRFSQLGDARWREMALRDATQADAIVLAVARDATFDANTDAWLHALAFRRDARVVHVLALIGDHEAWTLTLQAKTAAPAAVSFSAPPSAAPAREVFGTVVPRPLTVCAA